MLLVCLFLQLAAGVAWCKKADKKSGGGDFYLSPTVGGYFLDSSPQLENETFYGIKFGYEFQGVGIARSLGLEVFLSETELPPQGLDEGTLYQLRIDTIHPLRLKKKLTPFLALGGGWVATQGDLEADDGAIVGLGLGARYALTNYLFLRLDLRRMVWFEPGQDNYYETTAGLTYLFGQERIKKPPPPPDGDRDGVPDSKDECPATPRGKEVDERGCRTDTTDTDGDGVPDYADECPDTGDDIEVDAVGCPLDTDGDQVPDHLDECPGTPAGVEVGRNGCVETTVSPDLVVNPLPPKKVVVSRPAVAEPLPEVEQLPRTAGREIVQLIPDIPGEGGRLEPGFAAALAQSDQVPVVISVEFGLNRTDILDDYKSGLEEIAATLRQTPGKRMIVEGYTDSTGNPEYNEKLSFQRAVRVKDHLVGLGVDPAQIIAVGYGQRWPIADNSTEVGRQKNRRVMFLVIPGSN